MHDQHDYYDYDVLVRQARMERSLAVGRAIANGIAKLSLLISRANAALWHPAVRAESKPVRDTASAHR